jgi:uncharacterized protein (DUF983 family)
MTKLSLEEMQEVANILADSLKISPPTIVVDCPECGDGRILGCFLRIKPWEICVRDMTLETLLHEFGHFYYYHTIYPRTGKYSDIESEEVAKLFERLSKDISFKCQVCGNGVLLKEVSICRSCGAVYKADVSFYEKALLFGILAIANALFWIFISQIGARASAIAAGKKAGKVEIAIPPGVSPVLFGILTSATTYLSYSWAKKSLGWE